MDVLDGEPVAGGLLLWNRRPTYIEKIRYWVELVYATAGLFYKGREERIATDVRSNTR